VKCSHRTEDWITLFPADPEPVIAYSVARRRERWIIRSPRQSNRRAVGRQPRDAPAPGPAGGLSSRIQRTATILPIARAVRQARSVQVQPDTKILVSDASIHTVRYSDTLCAQSISRAAGPSSSRFKKRLICNGLLVQLQQQDRSSIAVPSTGYSASIKS
jgi:hypothetical protein